MNQSNTVQIPSQRLSLDTVVQGDCVDLMHQMPAASMDFVLTDPPYLVNYRSRDGRAIQNNVEDRWLKPAFAEALMQLIASFSCEGDVVLDPFCGSGSTLVAAHSLRRLFVGIELDPTYHALAAGRIRFGAA